MVLPRKPVSNTTLGGRKMRFSYRVVLLACASMLVFAAAASANSLANPGFESGDFTGWQTFGNCYVEADIPAEPGHYVPYEGQYLAKLFGNFYCEDCFNVSGIFQEFDTCPGDQWCFNVNSRHSGWEPMAGGNWMVQKLAFFDINGDEIVEAASESTILDASSPVDEWIINDVIFGTAPMNAVKVQALVLFLQPSLDGGAGQVDAGCLMYLGGGSSATESSSWGQIKSLFD
jgi:hypothetical protein